MRSATFFVAFLAAILVAVSGQTYSRITSGTCSSNGLTAITSSTACDNAACAMDTAWDSSSTVETDDNGSGCYEYSADLYFNQNTNFIRFCSSSQVCLCVGSSGTDTGTYTSGMTCNDNGYTWTAAEANGVATGLIVVFIVIPILIIVCIILICVFCCGAACLCCAKAAQQPAPAAPVGAPQYAQATTAAPQQAVVQMQPPAPPPPAAPLPAGWVANVDPASGKTYYVAPDQSTHWELPPPQATQA